ncbi:MAG TPA: ABC transporter ATP-binding protein [Thermomicrobiales bacterium]|jgi:NitT/TauT family transport system ATP-binding protein
MVQIAVTAKAGSLAVATPAARPATEAAGGSVPAIRSSGIGRRFETTAGTIDAIRHVNLAVEPGEFCVIVGPSGCGKTTFLRIIAGLERPTAGTLDLRDGNGGSPTNAMVFQGRSVFPWLTVRENVAYGLKLNGVGRRERRQTTARMIELVGLTRFERAYPHQLSEGMRQRVAIARALAVDPDLLLMDEPFGALDEQTRFVLQEELLRIWEASRKTVVFVTHSIDEALTLADRIVVFTAQPGTVKATLPVPFARPRELTAVRSDPAFAGLFREIWDLLREEVQAARSAAGTAP